MVQMQSMCSLDAVYHGQSVQFTGLATTLEIMMEKDTKSNLVHLPSQLLSFFASQSFALLLLWRGEFSLEVS